MRVAITGGNGFIGRATMNEVKERGMEPVSIDLATGGDVLGPFLADQMNDCDAVIHLAGVLGTSELFEHAEQAIDVNIKGTLRVLEVCKEFGMHYVSITMPSVWANIYQATKMAALNLATAWHESYSLPTSHVRAFNVYGPGQKWYGVQKIVPTFSVHAWADKSIPVWGDGTQTVDLIYVDDVASMLVDALNFDDNQIFDAGTGISFTVNEIAQWVLELTNSTAGIEYLPMRNGERKTSIVAEGEGWNKIGWHPSWKVDRFEETVNWYRYIK